MVQLLLTSNATVDAVDNEQQTPLMYAVDCEQFDVVHSLLRAGKGLLVVCIDSRLTGRVIYNR